MPITNLNTKGMEIKLSLSETSHPFMRQAEPSPKYIFAKNPRKGIYDETKAVFELFDGITQGTMSLKYIKGRYQSHYFWVWKTEKKESYLPVFKDDYIPENIHKRKLCSLKNFPFFEYKNKLYMILKASDNTTHIEELEIHTTSAEAKAMAKADGMDNAEVYVAKTYLIYHNNKAYDFLGYCWRAQTDAYSHELPIFSDDYKKIIRANPNELYFEEVFPGEKILHAGILWKICETKEDGIFLVQNSTPMHLITNNIINH